MRRSARVSSATSSFSSMTNASVFEFMFSASVLCTQWLVFFVMLASAPLCVNGAPEVDCTGTICIANWTTDAGRLGFDSSAQFQLFASSQSSDTSGSAHGALLCLGTATTCRFSLPLCLPRVYIYTIASSPDSAAVVLHSDLGDTHQAVDLPQTLDFDKDGGASFRFFYGNQRTSTTVELYWATLQTNTTAEAIWGSQFNVSVRLEAERYLPQSGAIEGTLVPSLSTELFALQFTKAVTRLQPSTSYEMRIQATICTNQTVYSPWIRLRTSNQADFVQTTSTAMPTLNPPVYIDAVFRVLGPNAVFYAEPLVVTTAIITDLFRSALAPNNDDVQVLCFGASATDGSVIVLRVQIAAAGALTVQRQLDAFANSSLLSGFATNLFSQRGYLGSTVTIQTVRNSSSALSAQSVSCPVGTSPPITPAATISITTAKGAVSTSQKNASSSPVPTAASNASDDGGLLSNSSFLLSIGIIGGVSVLLCIACIVWQWCCRPPMDHVDSSQTLTNNFSMSHVQSALYEASVF
eukprot:m.437719 g.437719  ORF g.437719 m.437719 type:complete len:523 (-) comp21438_c0_seq6:748-2316(-)